LNIAIIGTGYVGLVTGTCLAETGNQVVCVDNNPEKITQLQKGAVPFYEPGLEELVHRHSASGSLCFSTDLAEAVAKALIIFICVGTPPGQEGAADLTAVESVAKDIARAMNGYKVIVTKSTVPVGTTDALAKKIALFTTQPFDMVSNPEFLKQGDAVHDFLKPDHIVIGTTSAKAAETMRELYAPFVRTGSPVLLTDTRSSEMTKYATNAMLAARISFMNEIANLCELVGADVEIVRKGLGADKRIGSSFIFPGVGYGGSCLPKDVKALAQMGRQNGYTLRLCEAVDYVNHSQADRFFKKIEQHFGSLAGVKIALWGLSFKPRTDDLREAPSIRLIQRLLSAGAQISAHDPQAMSLVAKAYPSGIRFSHDAYDAAAGAQAIALITEWNEFRNPDFARVKKTMQSPIIFDGRNIYDGTKLRQMGFTYYGIGRP